MTITYNMEELLPLLSEIIRKYTSNESTSVTYETARQLLSSILYCLQDVDMEEGTELSNGPLNLRKAYEIGLGKKKEKIKLAKKLFQDISSVWNGYGNRCYYDTIIKGMPAFFSKYDVKFDAPNHILTLDYPLFKDMKEDNGIDLIYRYLEAVKIENHFLMYFLSQGVQSTLKGYHHNYKELILNICEIVLFKAIGCDQARRQIQELELTQEEAKSASMKLEGMDEGQFSKAIEASFHKIMKNIESNILEKEKFREYFESELPRILKEFQAYKKNGRLIMLFPVEKPKTHKSISCFQDGTPMKDEELRKMINKMQECTCLSDKIKFIKEDIRSLADLKEVLKECFWDEEYKEVLSLLSNEEIQYMHLEIQSKINFDETLYEWENSFIRFFNL